MKAVTAQGVRHLSVFGVYKAKDLAEPFSTTVLAAFQTEFLLRKRNVANWRRRYLSSPVQRTVGARMKAVTAQRVRHLSVFGVYKTKDLAEPFPTIVLAAFQTEFLLRKRYEATTV
jgi:hypothetical protein